MIQRSWAQATSCKDRKLRSDSAWPPSWRSAVSPSLWVDGCEALCSGIFIVTTGICQFDCCTSLLFWCIQYTIWKIVWIYMNIMCLSYVNHVIMYVSTFIVQFNIAMELTEDQQTKHGSTEVKPRAPKYWTRRYLSVGTIFFFDPENWDLHSGYPLVN